MKLLYRLVCSALVILASTSYCQSQINAITSDGRKVILNDDGTWKYIFETDGRKVILNPDGTWKYESGSKDSVKTEAPVARSEAQEKAVLTPISLEQPIDSVKSKPTPPPPPKAPLNLDCSALVAIQRQLSGGDKFDAVAKNIMVSADSKTGFSISFNKTKNTPLTWITTIIGSTGHCIDTDKKILITFRNGAHLQIPEDGKPNCEGIFRLSFGGIAGKEEILDLLQTTEIMALRIYTSKGFLDQTFSEDASTLFKAAINCMPK